MCDVTVENFEEALARLRAIVPTCDFVSIDLEFTGLDHDSYGDEAAGGGAGAEKAQEMGGEIYACNI